jgi:hypothetical protein
VATLAKVSERIERSYDVVVIGGGLAGLCAAISAARCGVKVALMVDRPVLGGASSSESRVAPAGVESERRLLGVPSWYHYARETGIIEELTIENRFRNPGMLWTLWDIILWEKVTAEPNIALYLNTSAMKAQMKDDTTISGVFCWRTTTFEEFLVRGKIFIDASGDGHIACNAGAEYRVGRESRDEFGESLAPENADTHTMAPSIYIEWTDIGRPVHFIPPKWAEPLSNSDLLPMKTSIEGAYPENRFHGPVDLRIANKGFWWLEYGGLGDTVRDTEKIRDELLRLAFGLWNKIKNYDESARTLDLTWVGAVPGKRESRRFIGDHVLTQNDIESHVLFHDRVAYGGRSIDLHTPGGIFAKYTPAEYVPTKGLYSIPFSCLYSKNIRNLMMAGRNISVTHVALGTTRVQRQTAVIGQAVGTAAYLCVKYDTTPRVIYEKHIRELQQLLLKHDCFIIELRNDDPEDLARTANITASSSETLELVPRDEYELNAFELDSPRGQMFMITEPKIESIELLLESRIEHEVEAQIGLRASRSIYDFSSQEDMATATANVPGTGAPYPVNQAPPIARVERSWVTFRLQKDLEPGYYWVWLPRIVDMYWCGVSREPIGTRRVVMVNGEWRSIKERGTYCFKLTPPSLPYGAENIISGMAHPTDKTNIWVSKPSLPQHVELDFRRPVTIDTVYVTFDTNLDQETGPTGYEEFLGGPVPECVRDYALYAYLEGSWVKLVEERGNYQRHKKTSFDPVTTKKIRLEIQATNGAPEARVYEIRCYRERI